MLFTVAFVKLWYLSYYKKTFVILSFLKNSMQFLIWWKSTYTPRKSKYLITVENLHVPKNSYHFELISAHKWPFLGLGWHPSILIKFPWAKSSIFFIIENRKFTQLFKIDQKHFPFMLCTCVLKNCLVNDLTP